MNHLKKDGTCIYIDVPTDIIKQRLQNMKVGRIVGMSENTTLEDILAYRQESYEESFDYKFVNDSNGSEEEVRNRFLNWFYETVK